MNIDLNISDLNVSLREKIKQYKKKAVDIESYLSKHPYEWGRFQSIFNFEVDSIFQDVMNFEKENIAAGKEERVYKLKKIFINKIRETFVRGVCIDASLKKPFGYAGDFRIIEDIYENDPPTNGFDRLFDNYFQMSAISIAVRNRKDDFKKMISALVKQRNGFPIRIMNLASGPCREIREMLFNEGDVYKNVIFDCYDNDEHGIAFASSFLKRNANVNFFKENAMRIALRKDIRSFIDKRYDIIYSTGLFDYFDEKITLRLIENLRKLLNPKGVLLISDVRDKYSNPSVHFMEWVGDWNLVYRDDQSFREIFYKAGYLEEQLEPRYEQQGILQYIIATEK